MLLVYQIEIYAIPLFGNFGSGNRISSFIPSSIGNYGANINGIGTGLGSGLSSLFGSNSGSRESNSGIGSALSSFFGANRGSGGSDSSRGPTLSPSSSLGDSGSENSDNENGKTSASTPASSYENAKYLESSSKSSPISTPLVNSYDGPQDSPKMPYPPPSNPTQFKTTQNPTTQPGSAKSNFPSSQNDYKPSPTNNYAPSNSLPSSRINPSQYKYSSMPSPYKNLSSTSSPTTLNPSTSRTPSKSSPTSYPSGSPSSNPTQRSPLGTPSPSFYKGGKNPSVADVSSNTGVGRIRNVPAIPVSTYTGDDGKKLATHKKNLQTALDELGANPTERAMLTAMAMQEDYTMSGSKRDTAKDADPKSKNYGIFNLNGDLINRIDPNANMGEMNDDSAAATKPSAKIALAGLRKKDAGFTSPDSVLNFNRGGEGGFKSTGLKDDCGKCDCLGYREHIASMTDILLKNPSYLQGPTRLDSQLKYVNEKTCE